MVFSASGLKVIMVSELRTIKRWKQNSRHLKIEIYALYLAYRAPRVPWYAKAFVALVVGYAFSPIDLIPDFIPVLGYLDDLVLIPFGVAVALKMIPEKVMEDCRIRSKEVMRKKTGQSGSSSCYPMYLACIDCYDYCAGC
jgi:uncharacterized membrane protein YkvA (DUF1232 family)